MSPFSVLIPPPLHTSDQTPDKPTPPPCRALRHTRISAALASAPSAAPESAPLRCSCRKPDRDPAFPPQFSPKNLSLPPPLNQPTRPNPPPTHTSFNLPLSRAIPHPIPNLAQPPTAAGLPVLLLLAAAPFALIEPSAARPLCDPASPTALRSAPLRPNSGATTFPSSAAELRAAIDHSKVPPHLPFPLPLIFLESAPGSRQSSRTSTKAATISLFSRAQAAPETSPQDLPAASPLQPSSEPQVGFPAANEDSNRLALYLLVVVVILVL